MVTAVPGAGAAAPLAGVRVLDLSTFLSGPLATHTLGDLGADVVKVEPPGGDPTRAGSGLRPGEPPSPYWLALHRDRRSIVLDLKTDAGRQVLHALAAQADVLVENFRPGVTARLGVGPDTLRAVNPRLVYCSISGFGGTGPGADRPATDGPVQAATGALELTGGTAPLPFTAADIAGAAVAAQAVLAALYARERTGAGTHLDLSLAESLLQWLAVADRSGTLRPPTTVVLTGADGVTVLVQTPLHFADRLLALVAAVPGCDGFAGDPRWRTREGRAADVDEYLAGLQRAFAGRTAADWLSALAAAGIPASRVATHEEALADPQLQARGAVGPVHGIDTATVPSSPFLFDGERRRHTGRPPTLGEHTAEVLAEWLGWDDARVGAAADAGAW